MRVLSKVDSIKMLKRLKISEWFTNRYFLMALFTVLPLIVYKKFLRKGPESYNNYQIFKYQFLHTWQQLPLYNAYPAEYADSTHYGPLFSMVMAPFALIPDWLGLLLFLGGSSAILFYAVSKLPFSDKQKAIVLLIVAHEALTSFINIQTNALIVSLIVLSFVLIEKKRDFWATALIVLGMFIKLYGVVGLAFFFFSKDKKTFVWSGFFWALIAFVLPMFISSPTFILQAYVDWFHSLSEKDGLNTISSYQDISVMGIFKQLLGIPTLSNLIFLVPAIALFAIPYFRLKQYPNLGFRLSFLASVLMFVVLFSSGSESPTYIIAMVGVGIWYVYQPKPITNWHHYLLGFVILLTCLSWGDFCPRYLFENFVRPYRLKALPVFIVWLTLVYQMLRSDYSSYSVIEITPTM